MIAIIAQLLFVYLRIQIRNNKNPRSRENDFIITINIARIDNNVNYIGVINTKEIRRKITDSMKY